MANAEWGVDLAEHALVQVGLSHRMYQSLRNAFNKSIYTPVNTTDELESRSGMYTPRPWYVCPVLGTRFNLPEPLPPLYKTLDRMKESLATMGLVLSSDGKISERPLLSTLRETFKRDRDVLKVFDVQRPAHHCFGIDHATISGARDFTQGGITMGGCYKSGSLLSEQKHVTLCVGRYHDDGSGLAAILGPKPERGVVGIANEFRMLSDSGREGGGEVGRKGRSERGCHLCASPPRSRCALPPASLSPPVCCCWLATAQQQQQSARYGRGAGRRFDCCGDRPV